MVGLTRRGGEVRRWQRREDRSSDRTDAIRRDDVPRERPPARPVGIAGEGIVDGGGRAAEVPVAKRERRCHGPAGTPLMIARVLIVREKERSIAPQRPAADDPALHVAGGGLRVREVAARDRRLGVSEDRNAPGQDIGSRPQCDVGDGAAGVAELGVVVAGVDAHALDRLDRRDQDGEQTGSLVVVHAVDLDVVGQTRLPVDVRREAVLRVEELGMRPERCRGARHRDQRALKVAIEPERQPRDEVAREDAAGIRAIGLQRRHRRHDDRFLDASDLQPDIHSNSAVDRNGDAGVDGGFEPRNLDPYLIDAVLQARGIVPRAVRRQGR